MNEIHNGASLWIMLYVFLFIMGVSVGLVYHGYGIDISVVRGFTTSTIAIVIIYILSYVGLMD